MRHLQRAAELISKAEHVIVITDYDNDGATSNFIAKTSLTRMNKPHTILMSNNEFPRGIHSEMVRDCLEFIEDNTVIITADTGSDAIEACKAIKAKRPDAKIIITDHHTIPDETTLLQHIDVLVNAQYTQSTLNKHWCGANVIWEVLRATKLANLDDLIGYVAFANLIDQMSMADTENRKTYREGVRLFKDYPMVKMGLRQTRDAIPHDRWMGIKFAPILNSCHRFGRPDLAVRIMGGDQKAFDEAVAINVLRKKTTTELYESMKPQIKSNKTLLPYMMILVTFGIENKPFCGLIASRVVQDLKVPTIVLNMTPDGIGGSGRTVGGFPFKDAIDKLGISGIGAKGHQGAFGIFAKDKEDIKSLVEKYKTWASAEHITYSDGADARPIDVTQIMKRSIDIDKGRPYGNSNPYPVFSTRAVVENVKFAKKTISIFEISLGDGSTIEALMFKHAGDLMGGDEVDIVFEIDMDLSVKLIIKELKLVN